MQVEAMMIMCLAMIALLLVYDFAPQTVDGIPIPKQKPERKAWQDLLHFKGKGGGSAPAPDPNIGVAAVKNAQLGEDWLNFAKDQFGQANVRQAALDDMTKRVTQQQLDQSNKATQWAEQDRAISNQLRDKFLKQSDEDRATGQAYRAKMDQMGQGLYDSGKAYSGRFAEMGDNYFKQGSDLLNRYKSKFQPIEDKIANDAMNWDSADRMTEEAAKAKGTVLSNAAAQNEARNRELASMGVNPASGRSLSGKTADSINTALAASTAENAARDNVRNQAQTLRGQAASLGMNVANMGNQANSMGMNAVGASQDALSKGAANSMQATNLGLAASGLGNTAAGLGIGNQGAGYQGMGMGINAGSTALNNAFANNSSWANGSQIMGQGFQGAMSGYGNMGNLLNAQYGNQLSAWNAQQQANASGFGGLMSGLGTLGGAAMMAWSSKKLKEDKKPAKGALKAVRGMPIELWKYKDGVADGGRHIGAYAEDFQRETGLGNGKAIPLQDAIGVTMKAVQELDKKVDKIVTRNAA